MWILFAQFFLLLVWFSIARILAARDPDRRGHWISIFCWALAFTLLTGGVGYANHNFRQGGNEAVVIENRTITRSEPREDAPAQLELPAGTYVHLTESPRRGFVRVKLMDGRAGYISTAHIERI